MSAWLDAGRGWRLLAAGLLFCLNGLAGAAALSPRASTEQVEAELLAAFPTVTPGQEILLGVRQKIIPHWHTYWKNPGDSGEATKIDWQLPEGVTAGAIQWPAPRRFTLGPVTNYGYADEVMLLVPLQVAATAQPGQRLPIRASVDWLVCEETCIPQRVELGLSLPVVAPGSAIGPANPLIQAARLALPTSSPWPLRLDRVGDALQLRIKAPELAAPAVRELWFYPSEWGRVAHDAAQPARFADGELILSLQPGEAPLVAGEALDGVLVITEEQPGGTTRRSFEMAPTLAIASADGHGQETGAWSAMLLALLGGIVLNLMPCVFPVLSIKALSLIRHAGQAPGKLRRQGLAYTAGVLVSFAALGGLLIGIKLGGGSIGWGFQYQSPVFVLLVAYLMFAVGLNLSGLFVVGAGAVGLGSSLAAREGSLGSFFTGVLATVVATPCTAPFMGAAVGFALGQPTLQLLAVFLSLGLGLALPYLLLCLWPGLQRLLPRPGVWMEHLKQGLAFPMYGAAIWLVWVLAQQAGINAVAVALGGMLAIAFAVWLFGLTRQGGRLARHGGAWFASLALAGALLGGYFGIEARSAEVGASRSIRQSWEPYSAKRLAELRAGGRPVLINLTASWCISCLVNEKVALSSTAVGEALRAGGITYLKGDWTNQDPEIGRLLAEFGRSGVPLYVYYPAGAKAVPIVLPQILTPEIVLAALAPGNSTSLH